MKAGQVAVVPKRYQSRGDLSVCQRVVRPRIEKLTMVAKAEAHRILPPPTGDFCQMASYIMEVAELLCFINIVAIKADV